MSHLPVNSYRKSASSHMSHHLLLCASAISAVCCRKFDSSKLVVISGAGGIIAQHADEMLHGYKDSMFPDLSLVYACPLYGA